MAVERAPRPGTVRGYRATEKKLRFGLAVNHRDFVTELRNPYRMPGASHMSGEATGVAAPRNVAFPFSCRMQRWDQRFRQQTAQAQAKALRPISHLGRR